MRRMLLPRLAALTAAFGVWLAGTLQAAESPVTVRLDASHPPVALAPDFVGLSFEVASLLPEPDGSRYFGPGNTRLIALFRELGIHSLRIGGNSSDRDAGTLPSRVDLDQLFGFARAAGVRVIYCLRLHGGNAAEDAATVKYIMDRYGPLLDCFSIGQEPSAYPVGNRDSRPPGERMGAAAEKFPYSTYREQWRAFARTIIAAVPTVRLCGPSVHNNPSWADQFIGDFGHGYRVALITEHLYPGGAAGKLASDREGRDRMLSGAFTAVCRKLYEGFVPEARSEGLPYRLEETNSYYNGGRFGASDTFAAALWGLDYLYWWAGHGAAGLNFHTGERTASNGGLHAPAYGLYATRPGGFEIRPLGYAVKAFHLAGGRWLLPVDLANPGGLNLSAYAASRGNNEVTVTLINKEHGDEARTAAVRLSGAPERAEPRVAVLRDAAGDIAAKSGITLGGAPIDEHGGWAGTWERVPRDADGAIAVKVPPATAVMIRLH